MGEYGPYGSSEVNTEPANDPTTNHIYNIMVDRSNSREGDYDTPSVAVKIEGRTINANLDSGATMSCFSYQMYQQLLNEGVRMMAIPVGNLICRVAIGKTQHAIKLQVMLNVEIEGEMFEIMFLVVNKLICDAIIGVDALKEYYAILDFKKQEARLYKENKMIIAPFILNRGEMDQRTPEEREISDEEVIVQYVSITRQEEIGQVATSTRKDSDTEVAPYEHRDTSRCIARQTVSDEGTAAITSTEDRITQKCRDAYNLTTQQRELLREILTGNKEVFKDYPGLCNSYTHSFVVEGVPPYNRRYNNLPSGLRKEAQKLVQQMLQLGIIEPSQGCYVNAVCWSVKSDGSLRFNLDGRELNRYMKEDHFQSESVGAILAKLARGRYITKVDLPQAFWQLGLDPEVRDYVSFRIAGALYRFCRNPFGLKTSCSGFLRCMEHVFGPEADSFMIRYVDDFLLVDESFEEHLQHISFVLNRLHQHGMTASIAKSSFCVKEVKFLGYVVDERGIRPDPERIEAIMRIPAPRTVRQLKRLLGVWQYQNQFLPRYAQEVEPLRRLLKKNEKWKWTAEQEEAFQRVRQLFANSILLERPRDDLAYEIYVDAAMTGFAGILGQRDETGAFHIINTASRGLTSTEKKASVTLLEIGALYFALVRFKTYIYHRKVTVYSDHVSLTFLKRCKLYSGKLARYIIAIPLRLYTYLAGRTPLRICCLGLIITGKYQTALRTRKMRFRY